MSSTGGGIVTHHLAVNRGDGTWTHIEIVSDQALQIADLIQADLPDIADMIRNSLQTT